MRTSAAQPQPGRLRNPRASAAAVALCAAACTNGARQPEGLPALAEQPFVIGALLCLTGPTAAKAPDLERTAILAEELLNGSTLVYPHVAAEEIPCRGLGTCGAWVGRDAAGQALRGPVRVVIADSEERVHRGVMAARRLVDEHGATALVGLCDAQVMEAVHAELTGERIPMISPVVTADSITDLEDRSAADRQAGLPGSVSRTVTSDYVQVQMLGRIGRNALSPRPLVRFEDELEVSCQSDANCASFGPSYECRPSTRSSRVEKEYTTVRDDSCADEPPGFCDRYGRNYECVHLAGKDGPVCAQYRQVRHCTNVVHAETAMVLYQNTSVGKDVRARIREFWIEREGGKVLSEVAVAPDMPATFAGSIHALFLNAAVELDELKRRGELPPTYSLADTVVFLFADAIDATLLLQEWSTQRATLAVPGADKVLWLGTDALRSRLLVDQLSFEAMRNLYVTDPTALDLNNSAFFVELFATRWGHFPGDFSGQLFDAILLVALANERAAAERSAADSAAILAPNGAAEIKNALPAVANGCAHLCDEQGDDASPVIVQAPSYHDAVVSIGEGLAVRLQGVSGNLALSAAGDRIGEINLWKVERDGRKGRFFLLDRYTPQACGINLEK